MTTDSQLFGVDLLHVWRSGHVVGVERLVDDLAEGPVVDVAVLFEHVLGGDHLLLFFTQLHSQVLPQDAEELRLWGSKCRVSGMSDEY